MGGSHRRGQECAGGSVVSGRPAAGLGVELEQRRVQEDSDPLRGADTGSLRDGGEQGGSSILLPGTSSGGAGGGRSQPGLAAGRVAVRLPAHSISPGSSAEGSPRAGAEAHSDSLDGLDEAVVRRPMGAGVPGAIASGPLSKNAVAGSVGGGEPAVSLAAGALPLQGRCDQ